jgi:hypothetical protein
VSREGKEVIWHKIAWNHAGRRITKGEGKLWKREL